jgi:hypothetical protein
MMRLRTWLTRSLAVWGGLSLLAVIGLIAFLAYSFFGPGNRLEVDQATVRDVRFVLNWCGLGENRIENVVHSYVSPRSGPGGSDYLDAYAIKISHVDIQELTESRGWYRADKLPAVLDAAVTFMGGWLHEVTWYPPEKELRTPAFYVYPWSIYTHGIDPSAAELIFVRPADNMVFYFSGNT